MVEDQVHEDWNIKADKLCEIYINDKQSARYFTSNNTQSLSNDELDSEIKRLHEQVIMVLYCPPSYHPTIPILHAVPFWLTCVIIPNFLVKTVFEGYSTYHIEQNPLASVAIMITI
jgi:hypothetical protein